jgi:hypothetical protein
MGLLQTIGLRKKDVEAQLSPPIMSQTYGAGVYSFGGLYNTNGVPFIDRNLALQVPAVSRCRNLICGVIASIDLELIQKSTGRKLQKPCLARPTRYKATTQRYHKLHR